jgi:hypothetical protein
MSTLVWQHVSVFPRPSQGQYFPVENAIGYPPQILIKLSNVKFRENLSVGSRADTCRQTDGTDRHDEIGVLREYGNGHEKVCQLTQEFIFPLERI